jgi:hypothetical protein
MISEPKETPKELKVLSYLRYLYGELIQMPKSMPLSKKAQEYGLPYYNILPIYLVEFGILERIGAGAKCMYKWNRAFDPNLSEAKKLLEACKGYSTKGEPASGMGEPKSQYVPPITHCPRSHREEVDPYMETVEAVRDIESDLAMERVLDPGADVKSRIKMGIDFGVPGGDKTVTETVSPEEVLKTPEYLLKEPPKVRPEGFDGDPFLKAIDAIYEVGLGGRHKVGDTISIKPEGFSPMEPEIKDGEFTGKLIVKEVPGELEAFFALCSKMGITFTLSMTNTKVSQE